MNKYLRKYVWLACMFLVACGRGDFHEELAGAAHISVAEQTAGVTPFISTITLRLERFADLTSVTYTIVPKPGTYSKPVLVSYDKTWLDRKGSYNASDQRLAFPVFGLYAAYRNEVTITASFLDGSTHVEHVVIETPAYTGPAALLGAPDIKTARGATSAPGFDYMLIKNGRSTPVVIDTDGNLRWVASGMNEAFSSTFIADAFYVGSAKTPDLARVELNGTVSSRPLGSTKFLNFHHGLSLGKNGLLAELDAVDNGISKVESILAEITATGEVLKEWDMADIFRNAMRAGGDDPSNFVRDGADWFHMNSAIYNRADNSLIVSSRENFVVKLDYDSGDIRWIFGDQTKHWYVDYPSLRALALKLTAGKAPIGQHSLSVTPNGELLLFNNGTASLSQPPGTSPGASRASSTPSRYAIDEQARTVAEVWTYEHDPPVYSDVCSSVFESTPGNYLITYSMAFAHTRAKLVGVNASGKVAFEFEYPTSACITVFEAQPIGFEALSVK